MADLILIRNKVTFYINFFSTQLKTAFITLSKNFSSYCRFIYNFEELFLFYLYFNYFNLTSWAIDMNGYFSAINDFIKKCKEEQ